jgi:hypothetical protein
VAAREQGDETTDNGDAGSAALLASHGRGRRGRGAAATEGGVAAAARKEGDVAATEGGVETAAREQGDEVATEGGVKAAAESGVEAADNGNAGDATLLASHGRVRCQRGVKSSDNTAATSHGSGRWRRALEAILAGRARLRQWASLLVSVPRARERERESAHRQGDEARWQMTVCVHSVSSSTSTCTRKGSLTSASHTRVRCLAGESRKGGVARRLGTTRTARVAS